jgi:DNA-binding protein H-NS
VGPGNPSKSISSKAGSSEAATSAAAPPIKTAKRAPSKLHYSDNAGNTWTGRGPKPKWLKAALDAGRSLEELTT